MRRFGVRFGSLILAIVLLAASSAFAEVSRGDRGEEVYDLQQLLFETGWLFELPDGIFGRNTEEAVKNFEEYASLPVDGIADDQMIYELAVSQEALYVEQGFVSDYFGEYPTVYFGQKYMGIDYSEGDVDESFVEDGETAFAECCIQTTGADGSDRVDYCEAHHSLNVDTNSMLEYGDIASAHFASEMWHEELNRLYDEWAALVPEEDRGAVDANRATFLASVEAQRMAANMGVQSEEKTMKAEAGVCQTLRNQAAWLCHLLWEQKNSGGVSEESEDREPVLLNALVIIDGDVIYYAGDIAGAGEGIYAMNADGRNLRRLAEGQATLMAASNGNLLIWHYSDDSGALEIIRQDGTVETVSHSYSRAIAHDGRFYFGGSSVAEDGSDHQWLLSSDPEKHDNYYPIKVVDGYLYYLDTDVSGMRTYNEISRLPGGDVELNRLNLETGDIELLSGAGTNYLDIDDGMMYYTRGDFEVFDDESGEWVAVDVDDGLYSMNLEALAETMIAEFSDSDTVYEYYRFQQDDVVYGEYLDYSGDESVYRIIRRHVGGDELPALEMGSNETQILCVEDGVLYGLQGVYFEEGEYFNYKEYIVACDLKTGETARFEIDASENIFYTEARPRIAVENDRIYCYMYNIETGAASLKSMALDGSDVRTIVQGASVY